jgi:hypothetical protein
MKTQHTVNWKKRFLIPGAITAFALVASPVVLNSVIDSDMNGVFISTAYAAPDGQGGKGGPGYRGGQGGGDAATSGQGSSGGKKGGGRRTLDDVLRDAGGDDSDAPPWAGTPGKTGKPGDGKGSGGGDTKKGGDYGDLWIILRTDDGEPVLVKWVDGEMVLYPGTGDTSGWFVQPLDAAGNPIPLDEEGHPVDEGLTQEVDFGRLNIARAPSMVLEHSLDEAISKLDGVLITPANIDDYTDAAGRLIDSAGNTIDSPLENLALYEALVNGTVNQDGNIVITVNVTQDGGSQDYTLTVNSTVALDLAAAAFAAASDKTGTLSVDGIAYISGFLDVNISAAVDTFTYNREDAYKDVTVWILVETSPGIFEPQEVNILDVVQFNTITPIDDDGNGIDTFTQAADDALQVIEYVHDNALQ